ncbi:MAG: disulfide bond formation protein B [Gammaproteobacteria bacterium]|nr:MAG: disulfide bond formation protein B [Gammaproteobacteria bacterium]RTZ74259.1 MAG: disulfide bond formation protein B [Gammaproteobacteria bacterium]RTZ80363.1 MAG: disulfide bond formation protein B [Gammaproteobacteria bacterium]
MFRGRTPFLLGFLVSATAMVAALWYFQHYLGLEPCPLCIFQRISVMVLGLIFFIGLLHGPKGMLRRTYGALLTAASLAGIAIAMRHLWLQYGPHEELGCGPGLDYMLETMPLQEVIQDVLKGTGDCGEIVWSLFGISIPGWTLLLLLVLLWLSLGILFGRSR